MTEQKTKVPAQFFQWFESLKQGYENSINKLFNRVEAVNEDHKNQLKVMYQSQIDSLKKSYQDHLHSLKSSFKSQSEQNDGRIRQLEKDAQFYQQQIERQNQTIDKLNDRYDAVIFALKDKMDHKELENVIKDISPKGISSQDNASNNEAQPSLALSSSSAPEQSSQSKQAEPESEPAPEPASASASAETDLKDVLQQAFNARQAQRFDEAYLLFLTAAKQGDAKAMGAIGRAHFVGEGTTLDKPTGLAWLIIAAEHEFEPAQKKIESAKVKSPDLYQSAWQISQLLLR